MAQALLAKERVQAIVGFHNIPGYPLGQPLLRQGVFACASQGLLLRLQGKQAHAAYPEEGCNPIPLLAGLLGACRICAARWRQRGCCSIRRWASRPAGITLGCPQGRAAWP